MCQRIKAMNYSGSIYIEWLLLNQQSSGEGLAYLETKPKQERNEEFWLEEHARKEARKLKKYAPSQIGIYR